jgi:hypothetical protein
MWGAARIHAAAWLGLAWSVFLCCRTATAATSRAGLRVHRLRRPPAGLGTPHDRLLHPSAGLDRSLPHGDQPRDQMADDARGASEKIQSEDPVMTGFESSREEAERSAVRRREGKRCAVRARQLRGNQGIQGSDERWSSSVRVRPQERRPPNPQIRLPCEDPWCGRSDRIAELDGCIADVPHTTL